MLKITNAIQRNCRTNGLLSFIKFNNFSTSSSSPELKNTVLTESSEPIVNNTNEVRNPIRPSLSHKSMVAAAFASLNSDDSNSSGIKTPQTDGKLSKAASVEELLSVSEGSGVSRRHALKVVSILSDWSNSGKVNISDFEADPRFIRLCRILTKSNGIQKNLRNMSSRSEDLSTVLSVTADDEAAKMVDNITLGQMVKVMSTLSVKKRRSTLLLRSLSYNITRSTHQLNLKQCGDLLFSMATLNFLDENLLSRIAGDITVELEKNIKKSSVIGSILTSIGLIKYKNPALLDTLCDWIQQNQIICRPQDIFSLLMTLAVVDYTPNNAEKLYEVLLPQLTQSEAGKPLVWLDIVWSLLLLGKVNNGHVSSVLDEAFISKLGDPVSISSQLKLLNIDGGAQYLLKNYKGPRISPDSSLRTVLLPQSKDKQDVVTSVLDTLKNLIQSDQFIRTRVDTQFGFYIDAECVLDKKCSPLSVEQAKSNKDASRVAILTWDYHDMCKGKVEPTGINNFVAKILQNQGYKVLIVPFTEFKPRDKLVHRVKYLETKLKEIVK